MMESESNKIEPSSIANIRSIYLSLVGVLFLIAFLSYDAQYPGLLSSAGIEPTHRIIKNAYPKLNKYLIDSESESESGIIDTDSLCNVIIIIGVIFSTLASW